MKKAIVVGASSGIGNAIAKLLVENGYIVGITGRRKQALNTQTGILLPPINIGNA